MAEYLIDLNATQAAIRTGYSPKTAGQIGFELLKKPVIIQAIADAQAERAERTEITADYVLNGIKALVERCVVDGEGFEPVAALRGYELLGKHLGLFPNKIDMTVTEGVSTLLENARRRVSQDQARALN